MNQRDGRKTWPLFWVLGVVLFLADQWVKWWTVQTFSAPAAGGAVTADAPLPLIDGVVELTRVHNYGAAWSSFSGSRWLLVGVTCAIVAAVAAVLLRRDVRHPLGLAAGTLIIAGGIGNIVDRVRLGYVVDMFHFQFWPSYPVFNVADIFVVAGVILFLLYYLFLYEKTDGKKNRSKPDDRKGAQD